MGRPSQRSHGCSGINSGGTSFTHTLSFSGEKLPPTGRSLATADGQKDGPNFFRDLRIAADETASRACRIEAMRRLAQRVTAPQTIRAMYAESFRNAGISLWLTLAVHAAGSLLRQFTNVELARMVPCDETGIRRALRTGRHIEAKSASVVLTLLQRLQVSLPKPPAEFNVAIAGLCWIAPGVSDVLDQCHNRTHRRSTNKWIPLSGGLLLDTFVRHPNAELAAPYLRHPRPVVSELQSNRQLMDTLEECVATGNTIMGHDPFLKRVFGELRLSELITDFALNLRYLEGWFYARELMLPDTVADEGDLLGIF